MLGKRIRAARLAAGLKQAELGRRVGVQGIWLYKIESGRDAPSLDLLTKIATALDVTLDSLVYGDDPAQGPDAQGSADDDNTPLDAAREPGAA